jgi:hypothetical protein
MLEESSSSEQGEFLVQTLSGSDCPYALRCQNIREVVQYGGESQAQGQSESYGED